MRFDKGSILWAFEALANAGHPDPEGLIARIESTRDDGNITGISKSDAAQVGISSIGEPVMSMFAATLFDARNNKTYQASDVRRADINDRINSALFENIPPKNPFLDNEGFLVLAHKSTEFKEPDDQQMINSIIKIMDETL